ncbi:MAG TPA: nucleotidyltransferase domain-containing protein [Clostridiales bacterium]|nr:nucleotidyltransferase domain-containing protein [Clostridiales bacterium]
MQIELFKRLTDGLLGIYGDLLISIVLYGSVARGTQQADSDIDIAVLVKKGLTKEMKDKMSELIVDLELEFDQVLSVLHIDYDKFRKWEDTMPFYINVKKEGVVLWQAA